MQRTLDDDLIVGDRRLRRMAARMATILIDSRQLQDV